jgi:predicted signal transduction protein with EAL and GGDEF domain
VRTIIMLAHELGLQVVAEDTETLHQVNFLRELGCDLAQGYFFSPPVPQEGFEQLLANHFNNRPERWIQSDPGITETGSSLLIDSGCGKAKGTFQL